MRLGWRRARCHSLRAALAAAALWLLVASAPTAAQVSGNVVNGVQELAEPTTGSLLSGDRASGYVTCSVALVGCDVAITTAHCFNANPQLKTVVFFQHAGFFDIESATRHPAYANALATFPPNLFDILRVEDIAFIKLTQPVSGVTPSTVVGVQAPPLGTAGRIVGFGRDPITAVSAATADHNAGIKRSGSMQTAACEGSLAGEDVLCWQPPAPQGAPGEDVSTCEGDSGGPLFVDQSGTREIAGLTKGRVFDPQGQSDLCVPPVDPYQTNVARHSDWLHGGNGFGGMVAQTGATPLAVKTCTSTRQFAEEVASGDSFGNCVGNPWTPGEGPRTCGFTGFLLLGQSAAHSFLVPAETTELRVAFNGISSATSSVDTNYYLRAGAPATTTQNDCAADGTGTLGYCVFGAPTANTWHVLVDQVLYQGEYQVTVSLFGPATDPIVPALGTAARLLLMGSMVSLPLLYGAWRSRKASGTHPR